MTKTKQTGEDLEADKPITFGTPSDVPSNGRAAEVRRQFDDQVRSDEYEYRGGRQSTSAVADPDDQDDAESAVSFGGAAEMDDDEDTDLDGETDTELDFENDLKSDSEPDNTDDSDEDQIVNSQFNENLDGALLNPK